MATVNPHPVKTRDRHSKSAPVVQVKKLPSQEAESSKVEFSDAQPNTVDLADNKPFERLRKPLVIGAFVVLSAGAIFGFTRKNGNEEVVVSPKIPAPSIAPSFTNSSLKSTPIPAHSNPYKTSTGLPIEYSYDPLQTIGHFSTFNLGDTKQNLDLANFYTNIADPTLKNLLKSRQDVKDDSGTCVTEETQYKDDTGNLYVGDRFYVNPPLYQQGNQAAYVGIEDSTNHWPVAGETNSDSFVRTAFGSKGTHIVRTNISDTVPVKVEGALTAGSDSEQYVPVFSGDLHSLNIYWEQTGAVGTNTLNGKQFVVGGIANVVSKGTVGLNDSEMKTDCSQFVSLSGIS